MKRRRVVVVVVSALLVVALAFLLWGSEREPKYQGRTLSAWLLKEAWKPLGLTMDQEEAVSGMGTNALPFLVKWVQYVSPPWRIRLANLAGNVPVGRQKGIDRGG